MRQVSKKIDNSYVVWFERSNRWIQFEEPAWYINKLYQKGDSIEIIENKFAERYSFEKDECSGIVKEIWNNIDEAFNTNIVLEDDLNAADFINNSNIEKFSLKRYLVNGKIIEIEYSSRLAEYYIHPPLAYLEIPKFSGVADSSFHIIDQGEYKLIFQKDNENTGWVYNDFMKLKKRLFINMANTMYNKTTNNWLSFVHASTLSNGEKAVLLSSPSGKGKSTLAALMQTRGLKVVSDDFVPIDVKLKRAFPFPAAISIKPGAFSIIKPYYKNISGFYFKETAEGIVHFIPPSKDEESDMRPLPVKEIIFINYEPGVECRFNKLSITESLKLFHNQAWVSHEPEHARRFINWFVNLQFFSLTYGNVGKGMKKISELLN
ncbi:MAG: hypothetical protein JW894_02565 [Bacteroidales bacterium]|nr:hypothetical protein [Bacteroidales bacterium]